MRRQGADDAVDVKSRRGASRGVDRDGVLAPIPCGAGYLAGQHRIARYSCRSGLHRCGVAVGGHRVPGDLRRIHAARRQDRRPVGQAQDCAGRTRRLRGCEYRRRVCSGCGGSGCGTRGTGRRRSPARSCIAGAGHRHRRPRRPQARHGVVGRRGCCRWCAGRRAQWSPDRVVVVASRLVGQRAHHRGRCGDGAVRCAAR